VAARGPVHHDHGEPGGDLAAQRGVVGAGRRDDQGADPALEQLARERPLALGVLVGRRREQLQPVLPQLALDAAGQGRVELVGQVAGDEPDQPREAAPREVGGHGVAPEAQRDGGVLHPLAGGGGHVGLAVEHAGRRLQAHSGGLGDDGERRTTVHVRPPGACASACR
jgi:hypothetical protein